MTSCNMWTAIVVAALCCSCAANEPETKRGDWRVTPIGHVNYRHHFAKQNRLLLGCEDKSPELWDTQQGKRVVILEECTTGLDTSAISPDGSQFATGDKVHSRDEGERCIRSLRIWETATGKLIKTVDIDLSVEGLKDTTD
jgi:hypothetical protein